LQVPGFDIDENTREVEYFHILFDRHEIIFAEGAPTESLYTGPEALKSLPQESLDEIYTLFPALKGRDPKDVPVSARFIASGRAARKFSAQHSRSRKMLLEHVLK
jgi:hypothetical protein